MYCYRPRPSHNGMRKIVSMMAPARPSVTVILQHKTSQVASLISIASPTSVTPVGDDLRSFIRFTSNHLSPATLPKVSATPQHDAFRGLLPFTTFRLVDFAVYTSSLSLPPATQDLLHGGSDFSFQERTYTCQISAPFLAHGQDHLKFQQYNTLHLVEMQSI
jgi:hypothetical protein